MRIALNIIMFIAALAVNFSFVSAALAGLTDQGQLLSGLDPAHPQLPTALIGLAKPNLAILTCEIKCLFSGMVGVVIVGVTIFVNGMLILAQKMTWQKAVFTTFIIFTFVFADDLRHLITDSGIFGTIFGKVADFQCNCDVIGSL